MKILLLGDASNYHNALAVGLSSAGHDVTVASDGSRWMNTRRDIDISRREGKLGGALLWAKLNTILASRLKGYDVVQLVSPGFVRLRPERLEKLFRRLKADNGSVFLTALGTDSPLVRNLTSATPALGYSEWHSATGIRPWAYTSQADKDAWLAPGLVRYTDMLYNNVDGVVSALYEYHRIVEAEFSGLPIAYGGIPIDLDSLPSKTGKEPSEEVRILYAAHRGREAEKGSDILSEMLEQLSADRSKVKIDSPKNVPYRCFLGMLAESDIVCDQLYSYTPATTALLALAMGTVAISGGEEEFYRFIGEKELRPIFNPDPEDIDGTYRRLLNLVDNPDIINRMASQGRAFVEKHNSTEVVASRFVDFWQSRM